MRKRWIFVLAVVSSGLLLLSLGGCGGETIPLEPVDMPQHIDTYVRSSFIDEKTALEEFDRQHKKRVPIRQGAKGWYEDGEHGFEVWVGTGQNERDAARMLQDMTLKLSIAPEQIFTKPEPVDHEGVWIYKTIGQERTNYYYQKGHQVWWIAIRSAPDHTRLIRLIYDQFN